MLKKAFKSAAPAEKRLKVAKFLQHWSAGLHGPGTWHGAGAPQTQRFMISVTDFEAKKQTAKKIMGMEGRDEAGVERKRGRSDPASFFS